MSGEITMAKKEKYEDWEINSDVETLVKANELLNDKVKLPKIKTRIAEKEKALNEAKQQLNLEEKTSERVKKLLGNK